MLPAAGSRSMPSMPTPNAGPSSSTSTGPTASNNVTTTTSSTTTSATKRRNKHADDNSSTKASTEMPVKKKYKQWRCLQDPFSGMPRTSQWRINRIQSQHGPRSDWSDSESEACSFANTYENEFPNIDGDQSMGDDLLNELNVGTIITKETENCFDGEVTAGACVELHHIQTSNITESNIEEARLEMVPSIEESLEVASKDVEAENLPEMDGADEDEWFDCREDSDHTCESGDGVHSWKKLYSGCPLSVGESMVLILLFSIRHTITGECLADLLTLIALHCAVPNLCKSTLYHFRRYFQDTSSPVIFHKYCQFCWFLLPDTNPSNCPVCKKPTNEENVSFFIECPILRQVNCLFSRAGFYNDLLHRFTRKKKNCASIEDIYDGAEYKKHYDNNGFLSNKSNFSLMWYTDGVPVFKSSKFSIWPIYFVFNELPYHKRMLKENMIFAGLWYGESKPLFHLFLKPCIDSLTKLDGGVNVTLPDGESITVRGMLLCGTCDLPAKSLVLNMNQFNGRFGCSKCLHEGCTIEAGRGHTRVYDYAGSASSDLRSHKQFSSDGQAASDTNNVVRGIKGQSWLSRCPKYDVVKGTAIDYMHCVLLGVVRKLLYLWFDSSHSREPFSLTKVLNKVEERLACIKPPNFITRTPRSIQQHCKFWKANECRSWLFYYSVPVLHGLMDELYFEHYCLLVEAIFILNMDSISSAALQRSKQLLKYFCCMFEALYGKRQMSANLHHLLHLSDCVNDLGPLWVYSCFKFEDLNGQIVKMITGTKRPELQICSALSTLINLPSLVLQLKKTCSNSSKEYVDKLLNNKSNNRNVFLCDGCYGLGKFKKLSVSSIPTSLLLALTSHLGFTPTKLQKFLRINRYGILFQSKQYTSVSKRNSYTISYCDDQGLSLYAQIDYFLKCCNCAIDKDCSSGCLATSVGVAFTLPKLPSTFISNTSRELMQAQVSHISMVSSKTGSVQVLCIQQLQTLCVYMQFSNDIAFVADVANLVESD